jgi:hypothetical protein
MGDLHKFPNFQKYFRVTYIDFVYLMHRKVYNIILSLISDIKYSRTSIIWANDQLPLAG